MTLAFLNSTGCSSSGSDAATDAGPAPTTDACAANPFDSRCLADSTGALFVSGQSGSDVLGDGTPSKPLKTIAAALGRMSASRRRVYVCEGRYEEDLSLGSVHASLVLVGGIDCTWKPNGSRAMIGLGKGSVPIRVEPAETPLTIDGIEAHSGVVPACESGRCASGAKIVAIVHGDVTFRHVHFVAGRGADGANGSSDQIGTSGVPAGYPSGGGATCANGALSSGGRGGSPGATPESGGPGGPANAGQNSVACNAGGDGQPGAAGSDGNAAGAGAAAVGAIRAQATSCGPGGIEPCFDVSWLPAAGRPGEAGKVGQGGGGGGSGPGGTQTGGGGGAGGCPGAGGGGGAGGGASIAVVSIDARVVLRDSTLETAGGGAGGDGGAGGTGSAGASGASALNGGCAGGQGGGGGKGTRGGGGAGGLSVGVLYSGFAPDIDAATSAAMKLGPAGKWSSGGAPTNAGLEGRAAPTLEAARAP